VFVYRTASTGSARPPGLGPVSDGPRWLVPSPQSGAPKSRGPLRPKSVTEKMGALGIQHRTSRCARVTALSHDRPKLGKTCFEVEPVPAAFTQQESGFVERDAGVQLVDRKLERQRRYLHTLAQPIFGCVPARTVA